MSNEPDNRDTQQQEQQRIAALIGAIDIEAPASLHGFVGGHVRRAPARQHAWVRRRALLGGALAAAAVLALVLVLALGSSSSAGPAKPPTIVQAATLGLRPPTAAPPAENPHADGQLALATAGIAYPYWGRRFHWQSSGVRSDRLGGRTITTVFYASPHGRRVGYAIVAGPALPLPSGSANTTIWHNGVRYDVLRPLGSTVVTWRRDGHTCILIATKVSAKTLLTLARWQAV